MNLGDCGGGGNVNVRFVRGRFAAQGSKNLSNPDWRVRKPEAFHGFWRGEA
jgi:hypothetical protein